MISTLTAVVCLLCGQHFTYILKKGRCYLHVTHKELRFSEVNLPKQDHAKPSIWEWTSASQGSHGSSVQNENLTSMVQTTQHSIKTSSNILWNRPFSFRTHCFPIHTFTSITSMCRCPNNPSVWYAASIPCLLLLLQNCIHLHRPVSNLISSVTSSPPGPTAAPFLSRLPGALFKCMTLLATVEGVLSLVH